MCIKFPETELYLEAEQKFSYQAELQVPQFLTLYIFVVLRELLT